MMATTEIEKVPPTIQDRAAQVFKLKTIGVRQSLTSSRGLPTPAIAIDDGALTLLSGARQQRQHARCAERLRSDHCVCRHDDLGRRRDDGAQAGAVRRDLLMDIAEAVAREDGAAVFELAARAVESASTCAT